VVDQVVINVDPPLPHTQDGINKPDEPSLFSFTKKSLFSLANTFSNCISDYLFSTMVILQHDSYLSIYYELHKFILSYLHTKGYQTQYVVRYDSVHAEKCALFLILSAVHCLRKLNQTECDIH